MRRRFFLAVMTVTAGVGLAAGSAEAQQSALMPGLSLGGSSKPKLTPEQQEKQDRLDRAYKAATESQPVAKPVDPWGNARAPTHGAQVTEKPGRSRRDR